MRLRCAALRCAQPAEVASAAARQLRFTWKSKHKRRGNSPVSHSLKAAADVLAKQLRRVLHRRPRAPTPPRTRKREREGGGGSEKKKEREKTNSFSQFQPTGIRLPTSVFVKLKGLYSQWRVARRNFPVLVFPLTSFETDLRRIKAGWIITLLINTCDVHVQIPGAAKNRHNTRFY